MHIPANNKEEDWSRIAAFIRENGFGILVNVQDGVPVASHIPVELEEDGEGKNILRGHIARENPQWQSFLSSPRALVIFIAAHSYISSSWYHTEKIPTWNYIAVHVYGPLRILSETELLHSLENLVNRYEAASAHPVSMQDIPERSLENNMKAIVGFEIAVEEVHARYKLSQNRDDRDYVNIIRELRKKGEDNPGKIATEMEQIREIKNEL